MLFCMSVVSSLADPNGVPSISLVHFLDTFQRTFANMTFLRQKLPKPLIPYFAVLLHVLIGYLPGNATSRLIYY